MVDQVYSHGQKVLIETIVRNSYGDTNLSVSSVVVIYETISDAKEAIAEMTITNSKSHDGFQLYRQATLI